MAGRCDVLGLSGVYGHVFVFIGVRACGFFGLCLLCLYYFVVRFLGWVRMEWGGEEMGKLWRNRVRGRLGDGIWK